MNRWAIAGLAILAAGGGALLIGELVGDEKTKALAYGELRVAIIPCPSADSADAVVGSCMSSRLALCRQSCESYCTGDGKVKDQCLETCLRDCQVTAERDCRQEHAAELATLAKCTDVVRRGDMCACVTAEEEAIPAEVAVDAVPRASKKKMLVCEHRTTKERRVLTVQVDAASVDASERCVPVELEEGIVTDWSQSGVMTDATKAVQRRCCETCPDTCAVTDISWGACPYCLLDGDCASKVCGAAEVADR